MSKPAHNRIDHTGETFSYWKIVSYSHTNKDKKPCYLCRCVCGTERIKSIASVLRGDSKSCGCQNIKNHIIHGKSNSRVYNIWQNIKNRCLNKNSTQWKWYGARGIKVCKKWQDSFALFLKDMGEPPSNKYSIDRKNNNGNYTPKNCKWSTAKEQSANRRLPLPPPPADKE